MFAVGSFVQTAISSLSWLKNYSLFISDLNISDVIAVGTSAIGIAHNLHPRKKDVSKK